jgi:hypothetical protein
VFFLLPSSPTNLAPDEETYALLSYWVQKGLPVSSFPVFGAGLYQTSKTFILPASIFIFIGLEPLTSIRLISLLLGITSLFIFNSILNQVLKNFTFGNRNLTGHKSLHVTILAFYAFMPSNLLWSTLGLRESSVQFWLLLTLYILLKALKLETLKSNFILKALFHTLFVVTLTIGYGTRPETFLLLSFAIFFSYLFAVRKQNYLMAISAAISTLLGLTYVSGPTSEVTTPKNQILEGSMQQTIPTPIAETQNRISSKIKVIANAEVKANANRIDAASALPERMCGTSKDIFKEFQCQITEIPFRLFSVVFRPLPGIDNGSHQMMLASMENLLWLIFFLLLIRSTIRARNQVRRNIFWNSLFFFLVAYSMGLAMLEGNLGTAFRHKSTLLPIILLMYLVSELVWLPREPNKKNKTT